ncbi:MAG: hypothetical protein K2N67_00055, partial [Mucispirillum sp.]|nr:hypothetical protein [Mucispirillum sp.]
MFTRFILEKTPLILTQIDRDKNSLTYGDCDRNHWHLKTRDFSSAILQQSGLLLALLYKNNFPGNIYYNNINMKKWAEATVKYWSNIQLKDGSFNEYYPNEHGFPPTAFSLYSSCEIYKILELEDTDILKKIKKTAYYLGKTIEAQACNQEMASITAMYSAYSITKDKEIYKMMDRKLIRILSFQDDEGWFAEYGGGDIGYLSVTLDMMAEYYRLSGDDRVKKPLEKLLCFLMYFLHPNNTIGGEYGSRNTTYFLPNGLQIMSNMGYRNAEDMIEKLFNDNYGSDYFLNSVDDRYLSHYVTHSFMRALVNRKENKRSIFFQYEDVKEFKNAGLVIVRKNNSYIVMGMHKGGIIKIFKDDKEIFTDCGYRVELGKGKIAATNWQDNTYISKYDTDEWMVEGYMNKVYLQSSTPFMHFGLRIVSLL